MQVKNMLSQVQYAILTFDKYKLGGKRDSTQPTCRNPRRRLDPKPYLENRTTSPDGNEDQLERESCQSSF